jgi:hypothetical protein
LRRAGGMRARLAVLPALGAVAIVPAPGTIFTVAGTTGPPRPTTTIATATRLRAPASLDALPDGGFVVVDGWRVLRVRPDGRVATLLRTPRPAYAANTEDLLQAHRYSQPAVAAQADGAVLVAECGQGRVRRVAPDGSVERVAGVGPSPLEFAGEGGPAIAARLGCPLDVAADPGGGFVIAEQLFIRRVSAAGTISTIAGTGGFPADAPPGEGGPALRAAIAPNAVTVLRDGTVVFAEWLQGRIRAVAPDGTIRTLIGPVGAERHGFVQAFGLGAAPDGGFLAADIRGRSAGGRPLIDRAFPGLGWSTVAGSGRYVTAPPRGDERRGDGGPARAADLIRPQDVAATADGGVIFTDGGIGSSSPKPGLVRYLTPIAPKLLAAAMDRRDARFEPRAPVRVAMVTTAPSTVTVTARRRGQATAVASVTAHVPAGRSTLTLPGRLAAAPHVLALRATGASGAVAGDRLPVLPVGWLSVARARIYARELVFTIAGDPDAIDPQPLRGCRRFGARRVDCGIDFDLEGGCDHVVSIALRDGRPWWGSYPCPMRAAPHWSDRPRPLRGRDLTWCSDDDGRCPRRRP